MTAEQFAFWLHGFTELTRGQTPDPAQWKAIKEHLDLVFKKVTPPVGDIQNTIKIEIDAKDAEKTLDDLRKKYEDLTKKVKDSSPMTDWSWLQPNQGFPPGTIICSNKTESNGDTPVFIC
ncbi:hypothetical protein BLA17378_04512 [Burkholderia aenigmatica]|uniref:Uncharacterized protein n=1 Tax=Burkholderia aenigmatica TaxID=2015348 RepID=A0ABY6Y056_9BURK|nr:hypothetical protein [Burkholderia aenigmatica]VWC90141.1 hypothetical protein BLA17378_04512 [Burkholderia aenigmatica]